MRIALVVPGGVDRSGRERVVPALLWLIERLARRHRVHVIALDYYPEPCSYELLGATVHDVGRVTGPPGFRRFRLARRLAGALDAHGPFDVVHAYWGMPAGVVAAAVGARRKLPVVVTLSSGELTRIDDIGYGLQRRWIDRRAVDTLLRRAAAVVVPSAFMAAQLPARAIQPSIVADGVDASLFTPQPRADGPPWRLIRVGSLNRVKDYPTLLRALALMPETIALDIVGEDTLQGATQRLAHTLGIERRVTFHGWQPNDRLSDFYNRAHVNVVSSRHEASNVSMLEAACCLVPTVGTAVGYVADWHPDRSVAVPVGNAQALASAIETLIGNPERRKAIATAARSWAVAHDADWAAREYEALYQRVIGA